MKKKLLAPRPAPEEKKIFSSDDPEKKILLYIGKWINGKFWISELSDEKSGIFLSWGAHWARAKKFFWPKFFQTYPKA